MCLQIVAYSFAWVLEPLDYKLISFSFSVGIIKLALTDPFLFPHKCVQFPSFCCFAAALSAFPSDGVMQQCRAHLLSFQTLNRICTSPETHSNPIFSTLAQAHDFWSHYIQMFWLHLSLASWTLICFVAFLIHHFGPCLIMLYSCNFRTVFVNNIPPCSTANVHADPPYSLDDGLFSSGNFVHLWLASLEYVLPNLK